MCLLHARRFKDPGILASKKAFAHHAARPVAGAVADHRAEEEREHHEHDVQFSRRGKKPRDDEKRVARQEEPDRESGFRENDEPEAEIYPIPEQGKKIVDQMGRIQEFAYRVKDVDECFHLLL